MIAAVRDTTDGEALVRLRAAGILVNGVCLGWWPPTWAALRTTVGDSAATVVWAVDLPDGGPTGGFVRDGAPMPW